MKLRKLAWLAFAAWPVPAYAHSPVPGIEGFYIGLLHPFSTPAQALLMLGLGLLIGGFDKRFFGWPFLAFVIFVLFGTISFVTWHGARMLALGQISWVNFAWFMPDRPAGSEIRWRTTGRSLPIKVDISPWSLKYRSTFANFSSVIQTYFPYLSRSGRPR